MNQKYKSMIYERVDLARKGETKTVISKMDTGWLVLGDNQNIPGYCVFLSDPVVENIHSLEINQRTKFMKEMTIAGEALQKSRWCQADQLFNIGECGYRPACTHSPKV